MNTIEQHPLRIERYGKDGWWFVACDGIPGLSSFGPDLDDVFKRLEEAGTELLRRRGRRNAVVTVERIAESDDPDPMIPVWQSAEQPTVPDKYELHAQAA